MKWIKIDEFEPDFSRGKDVRYIRDIIDGDDFLIKDLSNNIYVAFFGCSGDLYVRGCRRMPNEGVPIETITHWGFVDQVDCK